MKSTTFRMFTLVMAGIMSLLVLNAHGDSLKLDKEDFESVEDAVAHIQSDLNNKNFEVVLVVNHSAAAASVGLTLPPTQVIFARQPKYLEFSTLRRSSTIGIDLPVKILVYEDENGDIQIRNNDIGYLIDRHDAKVFDYVWDQSRRLINDAGESETGLVTISSARSLNATVEALTDAISSNSNFRIPLVLDFCEGRSRECSQLIVFGNPNAGTPLMQATQEVGIDLPQKFLVSKSYNGKVSITYNDPFFIAKRHGIQGQDERLQAISNALANFSALGAGAP